MDKVSFIITATHCLDNIDQCVSSINIQKGVEKEIIIGSNKFKREDIEAKLTGNFNIVWVCDLDIKTIGEVRNNAMDIATGEFVCFLREGDFVKGNSVVSLVKSLKSTDFKFIVGKSYRFVKKGGGYKRRDSIYFECKQGEYLKNIYDDVYLFDKIFKLSYIREKNVRFAETDYYDYIAFLNKLYSYTKSCYAPNVGFHIERVRAGLDKIKNPKLEQKVDIKQLDDMIFLLNDVYENIKVDEYSYQVSRYFIEFLLKRGLKYKNVVGDLDNFFEKVSKALSCVDLENYSLSENNFKKLSLIKDKKFEEYMKALSLEKTKKEKRKNLKVYVKYTMFKKLYKNCCLKPINKGEVLFISYSEGMDGNFEYIQKEIEKYNESVSKKNRFKCKVISTKTDLLGKVNLTYAMSKAEFIVVSEFIPLFQHLDIRKETKVIQSWHAAGAFKKFGFSTNYLAGGPNPFENKKMGIHKGYTFATVSSEEVSRHYAEAFNLKIENVIPTGLPRTDFFFDKEKVDAKKKSIYDLYPELKDKKVILYAPTFRGFGKKRKNFEMEFDYEYIAKNISDEYIVALKLHPSIVSSDIEISEGLKDKVVNISSYRDANDLLPIVDLLITDYSSIIFDYSLLGGPMIFFAYDLDEYRYDRDFYYEYEDFVPGPIARTNEDIVRSINNNNFDSKIVEDFCSKFFVAKDGNSSKRFLDEVLLKYRSK